jgi:hypothetical protein
VKINPNEKQLVVYRVTTLLFPGKQPIVCLKRETTLSGSDICQKLLNTHFKSVENITDDRFVPYITGCVVNFNINMK